MKLFDISIIVLLAPPLMKATSRHCIYIYIYINKSGKTVSKELNENSEH